jgi:hypothetical protein
MQPIDQKTPNKMKSSRMETKTKRNAGTAEGLTNRPKFAGTVAFASPGGRTCEVANQP